MKYAFFPGCTAPFRTYGYEVSTRLVAKQLDIELMSMEGSNCCGFAVRPIDKLSSIVLAARNFCLAEKMALDICVICNGCYENFIVARNGLLTDPKLRREVNDILSEIDMEFTESVEIKHFARILFEEVGISKIKESVVSPLEGLRVAVHYGCHVLKPSYELGFSDWENPRWLDQLVEVTGAKSMPYVDKMACCGGPIMGSAMDLATNMIRDKLIKIKSVNVDAIVTICPFCALQFDLTQLGAEKKFNETYRIPLFHYPQLLGIAQGLDPFDLGFFENRVNVSTALEKVGIIF